jgi:hypothetical protein
VPVLSSIVHTLQEKENRAMRSDFFFGIWDNYFPSVLMWSVPPPPDRGARLWNDHPSNAPQPLDTTGPPGYLYPGEPL